MRQKKLGGNLAIKGRGMGRDSSKDARLESEEPLKERQKESDTSNRRLETAIEWGKKKRKLSSKETYIIAP